MMSARETTVTGDLSGLPESETGARHLVWWGNAGFMAIEGIGFALAAGAYLYLASQSKAWPPAGDRLPDLAWSGIFTIGLIASALPNIWVLRRAEAKDEGGVRIGALAMTIVGTVLLAVRWI
ncbi:MAG TPA: cytochrome C oxidase subunit III, partial [Sphingomonas sp.]